MDEIIKIVQTVGFPIVIAIYLLVRYDKRLESLGDILNEINVNLAKINKTLGDGND